MLFECLVVFVPRSLKASWDALCAARSVLGTLERVSFVTEDLSPDSVADVAASLSLRVAYHYTLASWVWQVGLSASTLGILLLILGFGMGVLPLLAGLVAVLAWGISFRIALVDLFEYVLALIDAFGTARAADVVADVTTASRCHSDPVDDLLAQLDRMLAAPTRYDCSAGHRAGCMHRPLKANLRRANEWPARLRERLA